MYIYIHIFTCIYTYIPYGCGVKIAYVCKSKRMRACQVRREECKGGMYARHGRNREIASDRAGARYTRPASRYTRQL